MSLPAEGPAAFLAHQAALDRKLLQVITDCFFNEPSVDYSEWALTVISWRRCFAAVALSVLPRYLLSA
jgi:hypothetical protein